MARIVIKIKNNANIAFPYIAVKKAVLLLPFKNDVTDKWFDSIFWVAQSILYWKEKYLMFLFFYHS